MYGGSFIVSGLLWFASGVARGVACGVACGVALDVAWRCLRNCTVLRHCVNCNWLDESFILKGSPYA